MSISDFLEMNAASACSFDLMICFRGRVLIFQLQLDRGPMNASSANLSQRKIDLIVLFSP